MPTRLGSGSRRGPWFKGWLCLYRDAVKLPSAGDLPYPAALLERVRLEEEPAVEAARSEEAAP